MVLSSLSNRSNIVINRLGVAGAVLQTPLSFIHYFIHYLSHPLGKYLQQTFTQKSSELKVEIGREGSLPPTCKMSCVTCHVSLVMCHMSRVTCHTSHYKYVSFFFVFFFYNMVKLVGGGTGSVINMAYPV